MAPYMQQLAQAVREKFPQVEVRIFPVRNDFFGEKITVSGLVTGQDLLAQLSGKALGTELLIPCNMLRSGEDVFLDDVTVGRVEDELGIPVRVVPRDGDAVLAAFLGEADDDGNPGIYAGYELES